MKTIETLNADYNLWYCHYLRVSCRKCIGTETQKKRNCSKLKGFKDLSCDHMERLIHRRMKKDKEDLFLREVTPILEPLRQKFKSKKEFNKAIKDL